MRVLISGASGFIGRHVVGTLREAAHDVVPLARASSDHGRPGWDPSRGMVDDTSLAGIDAVVHLAGEPVSGRWTRGKMAAIRESRVRGTRALVDAIGRSHAPPGVLVSASAVGYYGDRGEEALPESAEPGSGFLADVCRQWEAEADRASSFGLRVVRLRLALVLGPGGGVLGAIAPLYARGAGGRLGSGRQWWPWVHIDDVAGLVRMALESRSLCGPVNVASPEPARQRDFARALGRALGRPAILPAPAVALRLVLGGFSSELLASRRALPEVAMRVGFRFAHTDLDRALSEALRRPGPS